MRPSWIIVFLSLSAILPASVARGEKAPAPGSVADLCPTVDARDTIETVRFAVAARLGPPVKEEALEAQYILTYHRKDGSQFFVIVTRDDGKLEVTCDTSKP